MVYETAFYDITLLPILRRCVKKQTLFEKFPAAEKAVRTQNSTQCKNKLKIPRIETSIFTVTIHVATFNDINPTKTENTLVSLENT